MALLEFNAITKTFAGPVTALDRFTLSIADRELIVLLGPSGAGKTTVLRITAGLDRATSGTIRLNGRPIDHVPSKDRDMAMVFQQPALYPHLTVRGNAAYSLRLRRMPADEIDRRIAKAATDLGIADLLDRHPDSLSGGQAQRAALARALVRRPNCLLLDEPFASLDPLLRADLRRAFRAAHRQEPRTTLFVTHDQDEALALADRLVIVRDGRIEQVGTPQQVYGEPANRFVAGFLGSPAMNFLEGALALHADELWFERPDIRLAVDPSIHSILIEHAGSQIVVGIRPEALEIAGHRAIEGPNLKGTIIDHEFRGDRRIIHICTTSGAIISAIIPSRVSCQIADSVSLQLDANRLHYFAADRYGRRLC
jgi:multiple sugar transport system ATP-binding protein